MTYYTITDIMITREKVEKEIKFFKFYINNAQFHGFGFVAKI